MSEKSNPYQTPEIFKKEFSSGDRGGAALDPSLGAIFTRAISSTFAMPIAIVALSVLWVPQQLAATLQQHAQKQQAALEGGDESVQLLFILSSVFGCVWLLISMFGTVWVNGGILGVSGDQMRSRVSAGFFEYANAFFGRLFVVGLIYIGIGMLLAVPAIGVGIMFVLLILGAAVGQGGPEPNVGVLMGMICFSVVAMLLMLILMIAFFVLLFVYHVAESAAAEEDRGALESWKQGYNLLTSNVGASAFCMFLVFLSVLPIMVLNGLGNLPLDADLMFWVSLVLGVFKGILTAVSSVFSLCVANSFFLSRRTDAPAWSPDQLATGKEF